MFHDFNTINLLTNNFILEVINIINLIKYFYHSIFYTYLRIF